MPFLNPPLSTVDRVNDVFLYIFVLAVAFLIFITGLMVYFVIKYNRKRNVTPVDIEGNPALEIAWTVTPLILFLSMFYFGWTNFSYMRNPPRDAMVIEVTARQWAWSFKYPNGKQSDELYVALNRPVKVELHSLDVLHGFYIAALRVKEDVVPGKTNYAWFTPTLLGTFDIQCTVMCGLRHSYMLSKVHVLPEDEFKAWYFADENAPHPAKVQPAAVQPATVAAAAGEPGFAVLQQKNCLVCHSVDGSEKVGVTLKGLYGKQQTVVVGGKEQQVTVDEDYLAKAMREPRTHSVEGYPPTMPAPSLTDEEIGQVIAYIKELK
jgi:cytochrome c oxidase subunit 2